MRCVPGHLTDVLPPLPPQQISLLLYNKEMEDLHKLLSEFDSGKKPSNSSIAELLRALRKSKIRRSDLVVTHGTRLIKSGSLSTAETYNVYEQVAVAALDVGDDDLTTFCIETLRKKFPSSGRVKRLEGMMLESKGDFAAATEKYDELLKENPSNLLVMKRKVCVARATGGLKSTADVLHNVLMVYPNDYASWLELGEIHLSLGDYPAAAYCFEELVTLDAENPSFNAKLADIYYTIGGTENYLRARKHYTVSLNRQGPQVNLRAVYGLISACKKLAPVLHAPPTSSSSTSNNVLQERAVNDELLAWARDQLTALQSTSTGGNKASAAAGGSSAADLIVTALAVL